MERSRPALLKTLHKNIIINKTTEDVDDGFKELQEEPTSPTISCAGKVKSREKCEKNLHLFFRRKICPFSSSSSTAATPWQRKKPSAIKPVFYLTEDEKIPKNMRNNNNPERKSSCKLRAMWKMNNRDGGVVSNSKQGNHKVDVSGEGCKLREEASCLMSKMKRSVACRRGGQLANFDWKTTSEEDDHEARGGGESCRTKASACLSKMNRSTACRRGGALSKFDWRKEEDDEALVSVQVQPRREINLWQRRTFAKPVPIQLIASPSVLTIS